MRMMGFGRDDKMMETPDMPIPAIEEPKAPVKSMVRVEFDDAGYKLTYFNDDRYVTVYAKTPSDHRSGKNNASKTIRIAF